MDRSAGLLSSRRFSASVFSFFLSTRSRPLPRFHMSWPRLYMHADHWLPQRAQIFEARITKLQTKLIFAHGVKSAVAFAAGRICRPLALFSRVNFWMRFERDHGRSPSLYCAGSVPLRDKDSLCNEKAYLVNFGLPAPISAYPSARCPKPLSTMLPLSALVASL